MDNVVVYIVVAALIGGIVALAVRIRQSNREMGDIVSNMCRDDVPPENWSSDYESLLGRDAPWRILRCDAAVSATSKSRRS